jgi:hypothetical protein
MVVGAKLEVRLVHPSRGAPKSFKHYHRRRCLVIKRPHMCRPLVRACKKILKLFFKIQKYPELSSH